MPTYWHAPMHVSCQGSWLNWRARLAASWHSLLVALLVEVSWEKLGLRPAGSLGPSFKHYTRHRLT